MAIVNGTDGNDVLVGTDSDDVINGLDGDDTIDGRLGADTLNGGAGNDTFLFTSVRSSFPAPTTVGSIDGGTGIDTLDASAVSPTNLFGGDDANGLLFRVGNQDFRVKNVEVLRFGTDANYISLGSSSGVYTVYAGAGDDQIFTSSSTAGSTIYAGDGADTIQGGAGDRLFGEAGNDIFFVSGAFGTQPKLGVIDGGTGVDLLRVNIAFTIDLQAATATAGTAQFSVTGIENVTAIVNSGYDATVSGDAGANVLTATTNISSEDGRAFFDGRGGDDTLIGASGADVLRGGSGSDRLEGRAGADQLFGDDGDDLLLGGTGNDRLDGGAGIDTASFEDLQTAGVIASLATGAATGSESGTDLLIDIENLRGSDFNDTLTGDANANVLEGRSGADVLKGLDGNDVLDGGSGADQLDGGAGDDVLRGGTGADSLTGGAGADTFVFAVGDSIQTAADSVTDFSSGQDRLDLSATNPGTTSLNRTATGTLVFSQGATGPQTVIGVNGTIQGSDLVLQAPGQPARGIDFVGRDGVDDLLIGTAGADRLFGGSGNDRLEGGAGDDQLFGDAGADLLIGGAGADRFAYRGVGDSNATTGSDIIADFASGTDKIDFYYLNGVRTISLNRLNGGTFVFASTDAGQVQVGLTTVVQGTDLINPFGSSAAFGYDLVGETRVFDDLLIGSSGNDRLFGNAGNDRLEGGSGDDQLFGDAGADLLFGGAGADRFAYRNAGDSNATTGSDIIADFVSGEDKIDFFYLNNVQAISINRLNGGTFVFASTSDGLVQVGLTTIVQGTDLINPFGSSASFGYDLVGEASVNDTLIGSAGNDRLFGKSGDDILIGGGGADQLYGEAGADRFVYQAASDSTLSTFDTINGFEGGVDKIDLRPVHTSTKDVIGWAVQNGNTLLFVDLGGDGTADMLIDIHNFTGLQTSDILF